MTVPHRNNHRELGGKGFQGRHVGNAPDKTFLAEGLIYPVLLPGRVTKFDGERESRKGTNEIIEIAAFVNLVVETLRKLEKDGKEEFALLERTHRLAKARGFVTPFGQTDVMREGPVGLYRKM